MTDASLFTLQFDVVRRTLPEAAPLRAGDDLLAFEPFLVHLAAERRQVLPDEIRALFAQYRGEGPLNNREGRHAHLDAATARS